MAALRANLPGVVLVFRVYARTYLPSAVEDRDGADFDEHEREVPALHRNPRRVSPVPPPAPQARVKDGKNVAVHLLQVHVCCSKVSGEGALHASRGKKRQAAMRICFCQRVYIVYEYMFHYRKVSYPCWWLERYPVTQNLSVVPFTCRNMGPQRSTSPRKTHQPILCLDKPWATLFFRYCCFEKGRSENLGPL